ncbi:MAG: hypothetical protein EOP06_16175 [Proteobacteria bacterium]|nr:MAG: hypothetical protein EOP06_16175 [Pseudomonadota bacterium]
MGTTTYTTVAGQILHENRNGVETELVPDPLGSVIQTRNSAGNTVSSAVYWPYGEVRTSTGTNPTPWGFVGSYGYRTDRDESLYVRARYYRPALTRWQTVDYFWPWNHPYSYVDEQATNSIDPTGLAQWMEIGSGPLGWYTHAYIQFNNGSCDGNKSYGFWPRPKPGGRPNPPGSNSHRGGQGSVGAGSSSSSSGSASSSSSSSSGLPSAVCGVGSSIVGSASSSSGSSSFAGGTPGHIWPGDGNEGKGKPVKRNDDPAFEKALCDCIRQSRKKPPQYCFGKYVCGSWAAQMWDCATKNQGKYR